MVIFNGRYRWDGTKKNNLEPIAWYPGSYDVKILACSSADNKVQRLKPFICLYARTGEGQSISASPEKFAQRICAEFSLDIDRVFWVEDILSEKERYEIILFTRTGKMGKGYFYRAVKRKALELEVKMIEQALMSLEEEQVPVEKR